ncbi:hypothetical protein [Paraburkholderia bannensis]|uniref:hypothetical protein n=1 Tax=Paraburkholderia bannensis TaxID=765414 RepID=UPI002ABDE2A7|nr:hypothetical protein [Paraburkholderia bannensis]
MLAFVSLRLPVTTTVSCCTVLLAVLFAVLLALLLAAAAGAAASWAQAAPLQASTITAAESAVLRTRGVVLADLKPEALDLFFVFIRTTY